VIVIDGVYGNGAVARVAEAAEVAEQTGSVLVVDETHSFGCAAGGVCARMTMHMHMHMYMCMCMCMCMCICVRRCVHVGVRMCIQASACACVHVCVRVCTCVRVCGGAHARPIVLSAPAFHIFAPLLCLAPAFLAKQNSSLDGPWSPLQGH